MDFKGVSAILNKYGEQITDSIQAKLRQDKTYASGKTYNSVDYKVKNNNELEIYYSGIVNVLDEGLSPKQSYPSITSIVRWMEAKNIQPRNLKTGRFVKKTRSYMRRTAFAIRSAIVERGTIRRFGYIGTGVIDFAFNDKIKDNMIKEVSSEVYDEIDEQITRIFTGYGFTIE
mgnify:CR=1 FL=1